MLIIKDFFHKIYLKLSNFKFIKWIFPIFILVFTFNVNAYSNYGPFSDLTIGNSGHFWSANGQSSISDAGYSVQSPQGLGFDYAVPSNGYGVSMGTYGVGLTQCDLPLLSGNYYSLTYYFWQAEGSYNIHPYYTSLNYKLAQGLANNQASALPSFNYVSVSNSVGRQNIPVNDNGTTILVEYYSILFKAQNNGVCLTSYFSSSPSGENLLDLYFLGYKLVDLGYQVDLTNTNNLITQSISQSITNTNNIQSSITSSTNSINGNIDDEFIKLKNQDHSYNQYASDNVPDSNNITNVTNAESDLLNRVNLDASSIDVTMSADTTNFIWDIVTNLRATSGKITLLFTSILSLAIIKMVLNR